MSGYPETDPDFQLATLDLQTGSFPSLHQERRRSAGRPSVWNAIAIGERIIAALLLSAILPLLALAGFLIVLRSRRCPLVAHERVGQNGKPIRLLKLRTMWGRPAALPGRRFYFIERLRPEPAVKAKKSNDPRVTGAFAAACRKYSIDELPQLWHVVAGDLALVGPRPLMADELSDHYGPAAGEVLRIKPGLTGLWQVRGRSRLAYRQRRRLDLFLVRHWSLRLYSGILLTTIPRVLTGKDAW